MNKKVMRVSAFLLAGCLISAAAAQGVTFRHTITGEELDLDSAQDEGQDTEAVQHFLQTGENIYTMDESVFDEAESLYQSACGGCHGFEAEGKLGPGLNNNFWSYPKNATDKGFFETMFGGAQGTMGPQYLQLNLDEMLQVIAWVRNVYTGPIEDADWLTAEQKREFVPYDQRD